MRIITGSAKGHTIKVPDKKIRPAQDMVRQAVFSMLHGLVKDTRVLDLFAGSGSYGLEALSRGARKAVFVDNDKKSIRTIRVNLKELGFEGRGEVIKSDAMGFVVKGTKTKKIASFSSRSESERGLKSANSKNEKKPSKSFDLIFLSPPYKMGAQVHLLKHLTKIIAPQGVIIFDHDKETEIPEEVDGLQKIRSRTYGATGVSVFADIP